MNKKALPKSTAYVLKLAKRDGKVNVVLGSREWKAAVKLGFAETIPMFGAGTMLVMIPPPDFSFERAESGAV